MALETSWLETDALPEITDQPRVVRALLLMMAAKHRPTYVHLRQVAFLSEALARWLRLDSFQQRFAYTAGLLHDIGKIAVADRILQKPGRLTNDEVEVMSMHATWGAEILERAGRAADLLLAVRHHHEWFDGRGYPHHLSGTSIPLFSRIITVVDAFDTMTSERPYRSTVPVELALQELQRCQGSQFDPELVVEFSALVADARLRGEPWALRRLSAQRVAGVVSEPLSARLGP